MRRLWILALLVVGSVGFVACDKGDGDTDDTEKEKVTLTPEQYYKQQEAELEKKKTELTPKVTKNGDVLEVTFSPHMSWAYMFYIDLKGEKGSVGMVPLPYYSVDGTEVMARPEGANDPSEWDIAFHHWYPTTNNGKVLKTDEMDLSKVTAVPSTGEWTNDIQLTSFKQGEKKDARGMVRMVPPPQAFAKLYVNEVLCGFDVATGEMMSTKHTNHKNVFIVKVRNVSYAVQIVTKDGSDGWIFTLKAKKLS